MTNSEFDNEKLRVDQYAKLTKYKEQLNQDESWLLNGILKIITYYQHEVNFKYTDEFEDKVVQAICDIYNKEVEIIDKQLNEL